MVDEELFWVHDRKLAYPVFDVDNHMYENTDAFTKYLPDPYQGLIKYIEEGDRIRIGGLGILVVRKRAAREGRNPATGETIHIKASKKVAFRPAKELKESVM